MARASILLPNGTKVDIEGTPEEVAALLALYGQAGNAAPAAAAIAPAAAGQRRVRKPARLKSGGAPKGAAAASQASATDAALLPVIVNLVKNGEEAEAI